MEDKLKIDVDVSTDEVAATGTTGDTKLDKFSERLSDIKKDKVKAKAGGEKVASDKVVYKDKKKSDVVSPNVEIISEEFVKKEPVVVDVLKIGIEKKQIEDRVVEEEKVKVEIKKVIEEEGVSQSEVIVKDSKDNDNSKEIKVDKHKKRKSKCVGIIKRKDISSLSSEEKLKRLDSLEKKILLELDTKLRRELDELKGLVLENNKVVEEYQKDGVVSALEIEKRLEKLEGLLKKVDELVNQVQILHDNYKFEDILNLTDYQDQNIVNDIIEFRDLLETSEHSEKLTEKYKMLDNFVRLYREVYIDEEVLKSNVMKASKLKKETEIRDDKYLKFKEDMDNVFKVQRDCNIVINKQNEYLKVLDRRISEITSNKVIEYKLRGVNDFLSSTLLYIGVMLSMPFKDKVVAAGSKALATGMLISNFRNMKFVQVELTKYEAEDFSSELHRHLDEVTLTTGIVDVTLEDIRKMRLQFESDFKDKVPGYEDVEFKLKEIELSVMACRKQLENTTERLNVNVIENDKKLVRVKELNRVAF